MTVFLSSHILSEIQRYCTHAAIIREGRLIACDTVEALAKTNAKRIQIRTENDRAFLSAAAALDGIRDLAQDEQGIRFLYSGDINRLLRFVTAHPVKDLSVQEPDLEEIFMHYYLESGR